MWLAKAMFEDHSNTYLSLKETPCAVAYSCDTTVSICVGKD